MTVRPVLAVDPGHELCAGGRYDGCRLLGHGIEANGLLLRRLAEEGDGQVFFESNRERFLGCVTAARIAPDADSDEERGQDSRPFVITERARAGA